MSRWRVGWKWGFGGKKRILQDATQLIEEAHRLYLEKDYASALALFEEALIVLREIENWQGAMWVRLNMGNLCFLMQDFKAARKHFEQCISLARNLHTSEGLGTALNALATIAARQGDYVLARRLSEECLQLGRDTENANSLASTYLMLGSIAESGHEARSFYERALSLFRELKSTEGIMSALCSLGHLAAPDENNQRERAWLEECLELCSASVHQRTRSYVLNNLANVERFAGDLDRASELYRESLRLKEENNDEWAIAYTLDGCAAIAIIRKDGRKAAKLLGAAAAIRERLGTPLEPSKQTEYKAIVAAARKLLDTATFESVWNEGRALPLTEAIAESTSE